MRRVSRSRVRRSLTVSISSVLIVRRHRRVGRDLGARDCFLVPASSSLDCFLARSRSPVAATAAARARGDDDGQHPHRQYRLRALCRYRSNPVRFTAASRGARERRLDGRLRRPRHRREDSLANAEEPPPPAAANAVPHRATNPTASTTMPSPTVRPSSRSRSTAAPMSAKSIGCATRVHARFSASPRALRGLAPLAPHRRRRHDHRQRRAAGQFRARRKAPGAPRPSGPTRASSETRTEGTPRRALLAPKLRVLLAASRSARSKTSAFSTVAAPSARPARYPATHPPAIWRAHAPRRPPRRRFPFRASAPPLRTRRWRRRRVTDAAVVINAGTPAWTPYPRSCRLSTEGGDHGGGYAGQEEAEGDGV